MEANIHQFEGICEEIRTQYFSTKPSRLHCIFTCQSLNDLEEFYRRYGGGRDHHYEIVPVNPMWPFIEAPGISPSVIFSTAWSTHRGYTGHNNTGVMLKCSSVAMCAYSRSSGNFWFFSLGIVDVGERVLPLRSTTTLDRESIFALNR